MLYMLKIGYQSFIVENECGLSTIMKILGKARVVESDDRYRGGEIVLADDPVSVSLKAEPTLKFVNRKGKKMGRPVFVNPEVLPPASTVINPVTGQRRILSREQLLLGD